MKALRVLAPAALALGTLVSAALAQDNPPPAANDGALAIGSPMPLADAPLKSVDGRSVSLASVAGKKGTLVLFVCNHCPWVRMWQERFSRIGNDAVKHGIGVIAVNSNDPEVFPGDAYAPMKARAKAWGVKFPYVMDESSDVGRAFGATHTPEAFLFDAGGKLVYHGAVDDNAHDANAVEHAWLRDAVDAVADGRAVPVAETKAMGCGIKLRAKTSSGT